MATRFSPIFYLLASVFAALSIGLWALQFAGWQGTPCLSGPMWHAHEMLFGFMLAVVVGFLFTAGRVAPLFTNAIAGASATKRPWLEKAALDFTRALLRGLSEFRRGATPGKARRLP